MGLSTQHASRAVHSAERAGHDAAPWAVALARWGYAAKGVIYLLMGLLTVRVAAGLGGAPADRNSALRAVSEQPFGHGLLLILAIGLAGYALWNLIRAALDPEHEGHDAKGLLTRLGYAAVGISYGTLAAVAARQVLGSGSGGQTSDATSQDWTARLLALPFGPALVILVGLVVLAVAALLFHRAYTAHFQKRLDLAALSGTMRVWIVRAGRCGYGALGVVFTIVGLFFIVAALRHNPGEAKGLGGALWELAHQPFGHVLLGIVALGLAAYGLYSFAQARYRRFGMH
jgi:uncharacterized protein DUF1206